MSIVAECRACGKRFKADEKQAGKRAKCSQCGTVFVIGETIGASAPVAGAGTLPRTKPAAVAAPHVDKQVDAAPVTAVTARPARAMPAAAPMKPTPVAVTATPVGAKPVAKTTVTAVSTPASALGRTAPSRVSRVDFDAEPLTAPAAPAIATPPPVPADLPSEPTRPRRVGASRPSRWKPIAFVVVVAAVTGAAVVYVPKLRARYAASTAQVTKPAATPIAYVPGVTSNGPAWSARPDAAGAILKLPDDFSLPIPAQSPLRHDPNSLLLAPAASPFVAITLLPDASSGSLQPTIEVWNFAGRVRTAQFKLAQALTAPVLSPDGAYYAGHFYDTDARVNRVEVWSTANATRFQSVDVAAPPNGPGPIRGETVLGFPVPDQVVILGDRLGVWDLNSKRVVREVAVPRRMEDTHACASARARLVAVADSRSVTLVDMAEAKVLGTAAVPAAAVAHPRHELSLRAAAFSPDGAELALLLDNRVSTRRIVVYDVASGVVKALFTPTAPLESGGPTFAWLSDSQTFLVGSGVLLDRAGGRQVGQIYTDRIDVGLGGVLSAALDGDRALAAWDKYPTSLMLRSIPFRRERGQWLNVAITAATASRVEEIPCIGREFGNFQANPTLSQSGRLSDESQFLVVDAQFTASLSADAPPTAPLRADQFVLLADGRPTAAIGTLARDGTLSLEKPAYDLRHASGAAAARRRSLVFPVSGREKSLTLRIGPAQRNLDVPGAVTPPVRPVLAPPAAEHVPAAVFAALDDTSRVGVRVESVRAMPPFEFAPEAAGDAALKVRYAPPPDAHLLAVTFELTANVPRVPMRGERSDPPHMGLLLPDGTHLRPAVELPGQLPVILGAGDKRTQTCLFVLPTTPAAKMRLTYEGVPVASVSPDARTAAAPAN